MENRDFYPTGFWKGGEKRKSKATWGDFYSNVLITQARNLMDFVWVLFPDDEGIFSGGGFSYSLSTIPPFAL